MSFTKVFIDAVAVVIVVFFIVFENICSEMEGGEVWRLIRFSSVQFRSVWLSWVLLITPFVAVVAAVIVFGVVSACKNSELVWHCTSGCRVCLIIATTATYWDWAWCSIIQYDSYSLAFPLSSSLPASLLHGFLCTTRYLFDITGLKASLRFDKGASGSISTGVFNVVDCGEKLVIVCVHCALHTILYIVCLLLMHHSL